MYGKLEIGQPAMIISCQSAINSWVIGKVVMVEAFVSQGELFPEQYLIEGFKGARSPINGVMVSGLTFSPVYIDDHCLVRTQDLMPLPPLEDEVVEKERELELA